MLFNGVRSIDRATTLSTVGGWFMVVGGVLMLLGGGLLLSRTFRKKRSNGADVS
jgi:hypothetical protein